MCLECAHYLDVGPSPRAPHPQPALGLRLAGLGGGEADEGAHGAGLRQGEAGHHVPVQAHPAPATCAIQYSEGNRQYYKLSYVT